MNVVWKLIGFIYDFGLTIGHETKNVATLQTTEPQKWWSDVYPVLYENQESR